MNQQRANECSEFEVGQSRDGEASRDFTQETTRPATPAIVMTCAICDILYPFQAVVLIVMRTPDAHHGEQPRRSE